MNLISSVLALCAAVGCGVAVARVLSSGASSRFDVATRVAMAFIFGIGLTAFAYVVTLLLRGPGASPDAGNLALAALSTPFVFWRRTVSAQSTAPEQPITALAKLTFALALAVAAAAVIEHAYHHPDGGWDATMIWNLRARDLLLAPTWPLALPADLPWTHPSYPLLLPAAVAEGWRCFGGPGLVWPWLLSAGYGLSTLALLIGTTTRFGGRPLGLLAGTVLLATPRFVASVTDLTADLPLAAMQLALVGLILEAARASPSEQKRRLALAGLAWGMAAWTKGEGLFFGAALLAMLVVLPRLRKHGLGWPLLLSGALLLLPLFLFRLQLAPPDDALLGHPLERLLQPARLLQLFVDVARRLVFFQMWGLFLLGALAAGVCLWREPPRMPILGAIAMALGFSGLGVLAIYLLSPYDLGWHFRNSFDRELLQLWPSALLLLSVAWSAKPEHLSLAE